MMRGKDEQRFGIGIPLLGDKMTSSLRRSFFLFLLAAVLCAATSLVLYGQSTTDGAIGGTVSDQSKSLVPNAKITARNTETDREDSTTTDDTGGFRIVQLRPGTYTVMVTAQGFSPRKLEGVVVEIGRVTSLEISLAVGGATEVVEVRGEAPVVDTSDQNFSNNLNQTSINELPINGRRWSNFALLTPGATPDGNFGLISFRGISGLLNNSTVDGGDNNQAFFSEERGRTRLSYVVSQASVSEFQVNTSNYSAEYGRAAGGVVNTITKSGSNRFHGGAFYYIRDNTLGATNPFATQSVLVGSVSTPVHIKPDDRRHQFGANLGGPIVKEKAFFFFSYDQQKRNFPGVAAPGSPSFLNPITVSAPPAGCASPGLSPGQTLFCRGITQAQTDAGLAFIRGLTGVVPRTGDQYILFPKLDWNITAKNVLTASYNRLRWNSPAGIQTQPVVTRGVASFGDDLVNDDFANLRLVSILSSHLVNEARFQYGRDNEFEFSQAPGPGEPTTGPGGKPPQIGIASFAGGITIGKPNFLERRAFPDESRVQFADSITLSHGRHVFKFGGEYNRAHDTSDNLFTEGGNYTYSRLADFLSDFAKPNSCAGKGCYSSYLQGFGPSKFEFATSDFSVFAQDDWRVVPRLTLNLGLRYEYERLPKPQIPNPLAPQTASFPGDNNNVGPRVGFAWGISGDGKTSLRGGYGVYYGRIINSTIANAVTNTGAPGAQATVFFRPAFAGAPTYPTVFSSGSPTPSKNIVVFSPNMQNPLIHEADLILEREIAHNTVVSASYLFSRGLGLPTFVDRNLNPPTSTITYTVSGGSFDGQRFTLPLFTSRPNPTFGSILEIQSALRSLYNAFILQMNRRLTNGLQFQTSYTLAKAVDTGQASQTFTSSDTGAPVNPFNPNLEYGTSNFEIRHRFVASAVWSPEFFKGNNHRLARALLNDYTISPIVSVASGKPFTGTISGDAPGGVSGGILAAGQANRPPFIGRNAFRFPRTANVDLRLSRRFRFSEATNVEILAEAFNLFNHTNITDLQTDIYTIDNTCATAPCLAFRPAFGSFTAAGNTVFRERQIQFAVRFAF